MKRLTIVYPLNHNKEIKGVDARHFNLFEKDKKYSALWAPFDVEAPNTHLHMIGVRTAHQGNGLGRLLLDRVHEHSRSDPASEGVSLTTEDPRNVPLYLKMGYEVVGHAEVVSGFETWGFFRKD